MKRLLRAYISYLETAVVGMCVAAAVFFIYGGIRAAGPVASIAWYAVGVVAATAVVALLRYVARYELSGTALQTASLMLARRIQRKEEPKSVSLVVVCFNEGAAVPLLALELSMLVPAFREPEVEILVVDDASDDNSGELLWRKLQLIKPPQVSIELVRNRFHLGVKESQEIGFKRAKGDLVLALNLDAMVQAHREEPFAASRKLDSWISWLMWPLMRTMLGAPRARRQSRGFVRR